MGSVRFRLKVKNIPLSSQALNLGDDGKFHYFSLPWLFAATLLKEQSIKAVLASGPTILSFRRIMAGCK